MSDLQERQRSWWGWGYEDQAMTDAQVERLGHAVGARLELPDLPIRPVPRLEHVTLPEPRVRPPASLAHCCSADRHERASHTYGKSFRDLVRAFAGRLDHPPDLVARPVSESEVVAILDWCAAERIAAIPYGGLIGRGGVEADHDDTFRGSVSIDLTALDRVIEIDRTSRAARIQGGALGPVLEEQLRPEGYTLRHFPQSFEFSTLGGWLATRSGGHYASVYTHIDDLVESMRVVTPVGISESRRLPGSGAGPSPDRLFLGSEGALGIITEAWMRIQDRPIHKGSAGVHFRDYDDAVAATRAVSQSALFPTNCRLLDAGEAATSAGVSDGSHLLVLGFESADHPVDAWITRAVEIAADHGGAAPDGIKVSSASSNDPGREGAVGAWRNAFIRAPYTRDGLIRLGLIVETFETACTWDRFPELHANVTEMVQDALRRICGGGWITCRFTHVYPDGPAPYFSVMAPGRPGAELSMWDEIKVAASEALLANGATITHHHAVGRDHDPWYRRQQPEVFARALAAAKGALDPSGVCNPGVIA